MDFTELKLKSELRQTLSRMNYTTLTPIQERCIPPLLAGESLIAQSRTGSGKTLAYALPLLEKIRFETFLPQALILVPTRELALLVKQTLDNVGMYCRTRHLLLIGRQPFRFQREDLKQRTHVIIATPGRLIDLMEQKAAHLDRVEVLVLDEADRMLDMGFLPSVKKIVAATPKTRQTLLFSATIDRSIEGVAGTFLRDPEVVEIAHKGETADTVDQCIVHVPQVLKADLLRATIAAWGHERVIVFTRTRSRADATCRRLKRAGYSVEAIHSSRTQNQRRRALENFAAGTTDILVATDVLARGIDVDEVNYVVNYD